MKEKLTFFSRLDFYKKVALKRLRFSLLIVMVYVLGMNIIIPGIDTQFFKSMMNSSEAWGIVSSMTGLSLEKISLFSLGYGPWMSTLIMWRVLGVLKIVNLKTITSRQTYHVQLVLAVMIGALQTVALLQQVQSIGVGLQAPMWMVGCFMITGLVVLIWLGNMNTQFGLGGTVLIVLIGMLKDFPQRLLAVFSSISSSPYQIYIALFIGTIMLLIVFFVFRFFQGELRLPLMHIMLDGKYTSRAYLPLPVNPAGAMPFMYTFSLVMFPQYILLLFGGEKSAYEWVRWATLRVGLDHFLGVAILIITLIVLSYGFSFINLDHKSITEGLQKSGDYFFNVYPGRNTEKFLFDKIVRLATVSTLVNVVIIGGPMLAAVMWSNVSEIALFIPVSLMLPLLMKEIYTQFYAAYHRSAYLPFVSGETLYR